MDLNVEFIQVEITRELYEEKVTKLIDALLALDEILFQEETTSQADPKEAA